MFVWKSYVEWYEDYIVESCSKMNILAVYLRDIHVLTDTRVWVVSPGQQEVKVQCAGNNIWNLAEG